SWPSVIRGPGSSFGSSGGVSRPGRLVTGLEVALEKVWTGSGPAGSKRSAEECPARPTPSKPECGFHGPSQDRYDVGALPKQAVREEDGRLARRCEDVKEDEAEKPSHLTSYLPTASTAAATHAPSSATANQPVYTDEQQQTLSLIAMYNIPAYTTQMKRYIQAHQSAPLPDLMLEMVRICGQSGEDPGAASP
ncbi:hypothetical protein THAOC_24223, partial [Thalassiosira oceanica]